VTSTPHSSRPGEMTGTGLTRVYHVKCKGDKGLLPMREGPYQEEKSGSTKKSMESPVINGGARFILSLAGQLSFDLLPKLH